MTGNEVRRLDRQRDGRPAAPVRIAHLGPGHFFRAHQAWFTEHAPDRADWGIAAFAGRSGAARILAAWVCHLRGSGAPVRDVAAGQFTTLAAGDLDDAVARVLVGLGVDDVGLRDEVAMLARELGGAN
ncbi:hypothetical protein [Mycolicibacterium sp. XJ1819]